MKLSTWRARADTREGTVKNAAIQIIKRKAQGNYSPSFREQLMVIIKLEIRAEGMWTARGRAEDGVQMPDCFRGEAQTWWDAANESLSHSAETNIWGSSGARVPEAGWSYRVPGFTRCLEHRQRSGDLQH